jgi:hypothetical protein
MDTELEPLNTQAETFHRDLEAQANVLLKSTHEWVLDKSKDKNTRYAGVPLGLEAFGQGIMVLAERMGVLAKHFLEETPHTQLGITLVGLILHYLDLEEMLDDDDFVPALQEYLADMKANQPVKPLLN